MKNNLLKSLTEGKKLNIRQQLLLIVQLSIPAIMAQISSIVMQYIDASMVGRLGADDSASIGLVSSSTWLIGSLCIAVSIGFTVQVAHRIGAGKEDKAREIVRQGLVVSLIISTMLLVIGVGISSGLPHWLGGESAICGNSSIYFLIYALSLPAIQMNSIAGGMLQCSGNMKVPSILQILMCVLDVVFNAVLIFPSQTINVFGAEINTFGAGLGVTGAALGTALSEVVIALLMLYFLLVRSPSLHLRKNEHLKFHITDLKKAAKIALPVAVEQFVMCGAQIASTRIVSPLGSIAIAANSFAVTAESLCYMPGYGIGSAATTLIGQSIGAKRQDLTKRLGWLVTGFGVFIMGGCGVIMYFLAPYMIGLLSPDTAIRSLGTDILRIEVFAEPMYAASIIITGVLRGSGDTLAPCIMNFFSMWAIRIPLSAILSVHYGLYGVWIAMCVELCVRGILFIVRLIVSKKWWKGTKAKV